MIGLQRARVAALAMLAAALGGSCGPGGPGANGGRPLDLTELETPPPVVLVVLDALDAGHLGHLGYPRDTSPRLDALAAQGTSFSQAFAPAPYTVASIPSILTGRLPDRHGLVNKGSRLLPVETTVAEILAGAGYRTCAAVANFNGSRALGCGQGFEEYVDVFRPGPGRPADPSMETEGEEGFHIPVADDFPPLVEQFLAGDDGRPPFLYLHMLEPHEPYTPPDPYRGMWLDPAYDGPYAGGDSAALVLGRTGEQPFDEADREAVRALYDGNLRYVDTVLGSIFDRLDEQGLFEDALVIVTSDHGEAFWQHGAQGHNLHLYDEMLRVPLIVKLPAGLGVPPGGIRDDLVSPMDLVPSLCEWLDLPLPAAPLDGRPLTAALLDPDTEADDLERELLLRTYHKHARIGLRTPRRKVIVEMEETSGELQNVELFHLDEDPAEADNRYAEVATFAVADVERLLEWATSNVQNRASRGIPLTSAERALLVKLGYVDED